MAAQAAYRLYTTGRGVYVVAMAKPWRPDMNDVDRLSKGGAAKRRGTGSFHIPHRLNRDERPVFEAAKRKGFLQVRGTGYRKGRKGHPLPNIYRQWCDAKGQPCIIIEQDATGSNRDVVVVDLAPLRSNSLTWAVNSSLALAHAAGARRIDTAERPLHAVPFDAIPVELPASVEEFLEGRAPAHVAAVPEPPPSEQQVAAAEALVAQQADAVRQLKGLRLGNAHPEVQSQVQELLRLKAELQQLLAKAAAAPGSSPSSEPSADSSSSTTSASSTAAVVTEALQEGLPGPALHSEHPFATVAIWQLPVMPLFFEADRPTAKQLAKDLNDKIACHGSCGGEGGRDTVTGAGAWKGWTL